MTWLWRTCFSAALVARLAAATVAGRVELVNSHDPDVRKHRDFSGVVVWLEPADGRAAPVAPLPSPVRMIQKDKRFVPHVLAIPVGTEVQFPNLDPIFHNAFSNFAGQPFDTGLYPPGTTPPSARIVFKRDGIVRVFCNIHSTMSAAIAVLRTPWYAVTDREGGFEIRNVPQGEYRMKLWHERATEATLKALERRVAVGNGVDGTAPLVLRISESGYIQAPHPNKYGREYPREPEHGYPGGAR